MREPTVPDVMTRHVITAVPDPSFKEPVCVVTEADTLGPTARR